MYETEILSTSISYSMYEKYIGNFPMKKKQFTTLSKSHNLCRASIYSSNIDNRQRKRTKLLITV